MPCLSILFFFLKCGRDKGVERELKTKVNLCETTCALNLFLMCSCRSELCITSVYQAQRNQSLAGKQGVCTHMRRTIKLQRFLRTSGPRRLLFLHLGVKKFSEHWYCNRKVNSTDGKALML